MKILNLNILILLVVSVLVFGYGAAWFLYPGIGKRLPKWTGLGIVLLTVLTFGAQWGINFVRNREYAVHVQVLSPDGRPLEDARVFADLGGEATRDVSGWTIRIPGASLPPDGKVQLYAASQGMSGVSTIQVGNRQSEFVTIRLSNRTFVITGIVIDESANPIRGAHVRAYDTTEVTDDSGRFRLELSTARIGELIRLVVRKSGYLSHSESFVVSEHPVVVVLLRQRSAETDSTR